MPQSIRTAELSEALSRYPRYSLAQLPTPIHRLENFSQQLAGAELWIKRDDLTGLEGGGNKTRKLEFFVGDAINRGADMLVTAGAIQSNHTRQTAAAAAKSGLKCALLHFAWTRDAGPTYRQAGNILLSHLMGAELFLDETPRPIEDQSPLLDFVERLKAEGHRPYLIPAGASEHNLGSLGYTNCAVEIVDQCKSLTEQFDYIVHCTGSSSTQAGLLAGFTALGKKIEVIGISDDNETNIKRARIIELANNTLKKLGYTSKISSEQVEVHAFDQSPYGEADAQTFQAIDQLARSEGLVADPVYEGKALRGLMELSKAGRFKNGAQILLMHLGGTPALHAYANQFSPIKFSTVD